MQQSKSDQQVLSQLFTQVSTSPILREVIGSALADIQQRTYWYYTSGQAEFLSKLYQKQTDRVVLKQRIGQITHDQLASVLLQIEAGTIKKQKEEEDDELEVQLHVSQFYDEIPQEDMRAQRGKERVKQINQEFKAFKEMMQQKKRRIEQRKQQKLALQQQFRRSLEKEKQEEHRQQLSKHIETIKKKGEERKESHEKYKSFLQQFKKSKPLHVVMEHYYKEKIELPKLEESQRKIESLPHRKKPTLEEINQHDRQYLERKANRPQKIVQSQTIDVSFKSHFYEMERQKLKEREEFEQNGPSWDFLEKQKRYSQFVKDKVRPKVSVKLKQSLEETLNASPNYKEVPDRSKVIEVGRNYLEYVRGLEKRRSATPKQPEQMVKESRYVNYLQELKSRSQHTHSSSVDWQRDMRDGRSSRAENRQRVLMKSKQLEQKAMRDEKFVANNHYGKAEEIIAKKKEIDETLISSIRAKVAVLKDARQ